MVYLEPPRYLKQVSVLGSYPFSSSDLAARSLFDLLGWVYDTSGEKNTVLDRCTSYSRSLGRADGQNPA